MPIFKFKAWDKKNEKMWDYGSDQACELWEDGCDLMGMSFINSQPNVIWLPYTGLKDRNGTEIYKGDILKIYQDGILPQVVDFSEGMFHTDEFALFELMRNKEQEIEIIGNIYENKELLNN